jgi:hypothetical protein
MYVFFFPVKQEFINSAFPEANELLGPCAMIQFMDDPRQDQPFFCKKAGSEIGKVPATAVFCSMSERPTRTDWTHAAEVLREFLKAEDLPDPTTYVCGPEQNTQLDELVEALLRTAAAQSA